MVIDLQDVKDELGITTAGSDYELTRKIDAAEAEYAQHVGPLPGTYTRTASLPFLLPRGVTSVVPVAGVTADLFSGLVTGYVYGQTSITYTVGPLPANHYEAIIADIAELWDRSQRDVAVSRPAFDTGDLAVGTVRPVTQWPRIRALAASGIA